MAISIVQTPATCSLAQSPIVFSVNEDTDVLFSSSFQYNADLYYWTGDVNNSGSVKYQMVKYPNTSGVGIFDFSRIINSTFGSVREQTPSNVRLFTADFYWSYASSSLEGITYVTSSKERANVFKALDGYSLFNENLTQSIVDKTPYWPIMTDGPATQSFFTENTGTAGVFAASAGGPLPTKIVYTTGGLSVDYPIVSSQNPLSQLSVIQIPTYPSAVGFPLNSNVENYTVQAYSGNTAISEPIRYEFKCKQKYPNVRIKWKNRYGQYDYFNFNMVSRTSFNTEARTYQPQLGSWNGSTLSYEKWETSNQKFVVDSKQSLNVNTDWVSEDYNEIFKQLLVSDEVYWLRNSDESDLFPITINTTSVVFKTGVNDKIIQYGFEFLFGQGYKLIL
jgi:hypothetical protein